MLPRKIFKIKGPRLAENAFPEISARKNQIKMSQHVALLFNLGVLKKLFADFGGGGATTPLPPPPATALLFASIAKGTHLNEACKFRGLKSYAFNC